MAPRSSWPLLLFALGCSEDPGAVDLIGSEPFSDHLPPEASGQMPPPARPLLMDSSDLYSGQQNRLFAQGAQPGERVFFGGSLAGEGAGPCPSTLGGNCLGILRPFLIGSAVTNANGLAELIVDIPPSVPFDGICLQAAVLDLASPALSNVHCTPIENPVGEGPANFTNGTGVVSSQRFRNVVTVGDPVSAEQISSPRFSMSVGVSTLTPQ